MDNPHYYEVKLNWETERKGRVSASGLPVQIEVATPPEFPKGMAGMWSPEHLLVAAVNSCLMTTFLAIAENSKFNFINFESKAIGKLEKVAGKYMISEIMLFPVITIKDGEESQKALRLLEKSEAACLISNSIKSKIIFVPEIKAPAKMVNPVIY
jgi:peroxiredoxin-like protein